MRKAPPSLWFRMNLPNLVLHKMDNDKEHKSPLAYNRRMRLWKILAFCQEHVGGSLPILFPQFAITCLNDPAIVTCTNHFCHVVADKPMPMIQARKKWDLESDRNSIPLPAGRTEKEDIELFQGLFNNAMKPAGKLCKNAILKMGPEYFWRE